MNYIEQINGFWIKSETSDLSGLDIAVYMSLLKYCNRLNWLNPFVCHWDIVCQTSKVSKNAYYKSIERLELCGLIKYQKGVKNTTQKPKILILELKNKEGIIKEQQGNNEGIEEEQQGNLYKHLNNKQINSILSFFDKLPKDQIDIYISNLKIIDTDKIDFEKLKDFINQKTGRDFKLVNKQVQGKYLARLKEGYKKDDIINAIINAVNSDYHKENSFKYLTPEFFSRAETLDKYSNVNKSDIKKEPTKKIRTL